MKIVTLILALLVLSACGRLDSLQSYQLEKSSPYYAELSYFVQKAADHGLNLESRVASIPIEVADLPRGTLARCFRPAIGDRHIVIAQRLWNEYPADYRLSTMVHELGHCILDQEHRDGLDVHGVPTSVMNSIGPDGTEFRRHEAEYLEELFSH